MPLNAFTNFTTFNPQTKANSKLRDQEEIEFLALDDAQVESDMFLIEDFPFIHQFFS